MRARESATFHKTGDNSHIESNMTNPKLKDSATDYTDSRGYFDELSTGFEIRIAEWACQKANPPDWVGFFRANS